MGSPGGDEQYLILGKDCGQMDLNVQCDAKDGQTNMAADIAAAYRVRLCVVRDEDNLGVGSVKRVAGQHRFWGSG